MFDPSVQIVFYFFNGNQIFFFSILEPLANYAL